VVALEAHLKSLHLFTGVLTVAATTALTAPQTTQACTILLGREGRQRVLRGQSRLGQVGQHYGQRIVRPHLGVPVGPDHP
jgi:hypothetical protein